MKIKVSIGRCYIFFVFFAVCIRSSSRVIFGSNGIELACLLLIVGLFFIQGLQKFLHIVVLRPDLYWMGVFLLTVIHYNREYDSIYLYAMTLVGILGYFFAQGNVKTVYQFRWVLLAWVWITAAVTWIQSVSFPFYQEYLMNLINPGHSSSILQIYQSSGGLSGLTDHFSRNAYYVVGGLLILLATLWNGSGKKNKRLLLAIGILFITILMIGKRGHFIFLMASVFVIYLAKQQNLKQKLCRGFALAAGALLFFAMVMILIPETRNTVLRFLSSYEHVNHDITSGRISVIYPQAWRMFLEHPLFGCGYGSFYVLVKGVFAGVHNDYLQWLCEYGITGFLICVAAMAGSLLETHRLFLRMTRDPGRYETWKREIITWSLLFQVWVCFYSLTGIPHYDYEINMIYCILCGVSTALGKEERG